MQNMKMMLTGIFICCRLFTLHAQASDTAVITQKALHFADSLVKANFYQDWKTYVALTCPSAQKYYGGPNGFKEHIVNLYYRNEPQLKEDPEKVKMVTLASDDMDEWQCVIQKIRSTYIDMRKAKIYTYLIGRSTDNGETWTFVDVSHNTIENMIYIMPGIFDTIAIPDGKTVYEEDVVTQQP